MKRNLIPWLVILLIAVGLPVGGFVRQAARPASDATTQPAEPASIDLPTVLAGRYYIGAGAIWPEQRPSFIAPADQLAKKPMQQVAMATVVGELENPQAAMNRLEPLMATNEDAAAFHARYANGTPLPSTIAERYGFFAELAESNGQAETSPNRATVLGKAKQTLYVVMAAMFIFLGAAVVGFGLFVTAIVLLALGKLSTQVPSPERSASSAYVGAFAIYLGGFLAGSLALQLIDEAVGGVLPDFLKYVPMLVSVLLAVAWPHLLRVPSSAIQRDWGLHAGRQPWLEPLAGIGGYLAGLPVIGVGILITMGLAAISGSDVQHPIGSEITRHPYLVIFLAVIFAPITEEILFRGALLSHLRGAMNPWFAALVSGVIFAAIHPQGWAAIPALGSIGFVLAMIRQWRGSLIASITAHAMNNGAIVTLMLLAGS